MLNLFFSFCFVFLLFNLFWVCFVFGFSDTFFFLCLSCLYELQLGVFCVCFSCYFFLSFFFVCWCFERVQNFLEISCIHVLLKLKLYFVILKRSLALAVKKSQKLVISRDTLLIVWTNAKVWFQRSKTLFKS